MAAASIDPFRFPTSADPGRAEHVARSGAQPSTPAEAALDHGIEETFPASDPVAVSIDRPAPAVPRAGRLRAYWCQARRHRAAFAAGSSVATLALLLWRANRTR